MESFCFLLTAYGKQPCELSKDCRSEHINQKTIPVYPIVCPLGKQCPENPERLLIRILLLVANSFYYPKILLVFLKSSPRMKKSIKKLELKKRTVSSLNSDEQKALKGGAASLFACPFTARFCPTPPISRDCNSLDC
jgi:hypothetical protein